MNAISSPSPDIIARDCCWKHETLTSSTAEYARFEVFLST